VRFSGYSRLNERETFLLRIHGLRWTPATTAMTRMRAALAGALVALIVALVVVGARRQPQIASTDRVPNYTFVTEIFAGQSLCQGNEIVPVGTAALRMTIGTYGKPGPPLVIRVTGPVSAATGARTVAIARGKLAEGWLQGVISVPVSRVAQTHAEARVCIANRGLWPVAIAGTTPPANYGFDDYLNGKPLASEVRIDYMLPGRPSWFSMLGKARDADDVRQGHLHRLDGVDRAAAADARAWRRAGARAAARGARGMSGRSITPAAAFACVRRTLARLHVPPTGAR